MNIDPRKVQLSEKDIEDWLWENPQAIESYGRVVKEWIGRQVIVPSGRIDLLGINRADGLVVVEVKNVVFESKHLTQVQRYARDLEDVYFELTGEPFPVWKFLIGPFEPDNTVLMEADAMDIRIICIDYHLNADLSGPWFFNKEYNAKRKQDIKNLAESDMFIKISMLAEAKKIIDEDNSQDTD